MRKSALRTTVAVLRQTLEMKTPEFAEVCGLSLSTVEKLETGRLKLSDEVAFRMAEETGVELAWLQEGDPAVPPRRKSKTRPERIGSGRYRQVPLGEGYDLQVFAKWRAKGGGKPPIWKPEEEGARLVGIIARAIRKGKSAYAKYRIDRILSELEAEYGLDEKRRRRAEEAMRHAPPPPLRTGKGS